MKYGYTNFTPSVCNKSLCADFQKWGTAFYHINTTQTKYLHQPRAQVLHLVQLCVCAPCATVMCVLLVVLHVRMLFGPLWYRTCAKRSRPRTTSSPRDAWAAVRGVRCQTSIDLDKRVVSVGPAHRRTSVQSDVRVPKPNKFHAPRGTVITGQ
jgi:hypothetical protein